MHHDVFVGDACATLILVAFLGKVLRFATQVCTSVSTIVIHTNVSCEITPAFQRGFQNTVCACLIALNKSSGMVVYSTWCLYHF